LAYAWGWEEDKFLNSSIDFFTKTFKGKKLIEFDSLKIQYEVARYTATRVLTVHRKGALPADWWRFPWDAKPKTRAEWLEENKELIDIWDKLDKAK
jgi:hypothetical protein